MSPDLLELKDGFEVVREGEIQQAKAIPRALLRDSRLSFGAKGLFVFVWDLPVGWRVRLIHLATVGPQRKDSIRRLLAELEAVGALRIEIVRGERGRLAGKRWVLRSPHLWAVEVSLSPKTPPQAAPAKDSTEKRGNPTFGESEPGKSAPTVFSKGSNSSYVREFRLRPSGLATWVANDLPLAEKLEEETSPEILAEAVFAVSATGKDPVPGLVARHLARQRRRKKETCVEIENSPRHTLDPTAQAKGRRILEMVGLGVAP
jgi:hypothetical protein